MLLSPPVTANMTIDGASTERARMNEGPMILQWREAWLRGKGASRGSVLEDSGRFRRAMLRVNEHQAQREGRKRAELAAQRAWRSVPAYRDFLAKNGLKSPEVPLEQLPVMSKDSYIRAYPTKDRCLGGDYMAPGVAIDESSGSTGRPYNWVRGIRERSRMRLEMAECWAGPMESGPGSRSMPSAWEHGPRA